MNNQPVRPPATPNTKTAGMVILMVRKIRRCLWRLTAGKTASLYIDDSGIKLVTAKGKEVQRWAAIPLEPGLVNDGLISDKAAVAARVSEMFSDNEVKKKNVIVGLSGLHCMSRIVSLPRLSSAALREAVNREAERQLPVPLGNVYLSWQVVGTSGEELTIFLVAYTRNIVDALVGTLKLAGIKPHLMDLAPLALTRITGRPTSVVVDVRSSDADIVIVADGIPEVIRSLPLPRGKTSEEKVSFVKRELDRTIAFFESTRETRPLENSLPVFVAGEPADVSVIQQSLPGNPAHAEALDFPALVYPEPLQRSRYAVNIGLLLKKLRAGDGFLPAVNINALPEAYRYKPVHWPRVAVVPAAAAAVLLLAALSMNLYNAFLHTSSLETRRESANYVLGKMVTRQQLQNKEIAVQKEALADLASSLNILAVSSATLESSRENNGTDLNTAVNLVPPMVKLTGVQQNGSQVTVEGKAEDESQVLSYAMALEDSGRFAEVVVAGVKTDKNGGAAFSIVVR